ncbi:capsular associated protein [Coprinopsis cinerea okayama7|uniref:Capsular associated protein n=1 Tax=Coprinopsis cinerea (strain Okayama-7 / 130 / ATCC MYA-4618 / FGSC 9003) TaxID=240176 RepID=A8P149_COPC7|nr:capsular associated protein [Coprinopsis cinerea okayama7\|eukprot:XP_001838024.1 capsular associated protein [Coprinopsis cinerea okayama7\
MVVKYEKAHGQHGLWNQFRRVPAPVALAIGILFGFIFARIAPFSTSSVPVWRSGHVPAVKARSTSRYPIPPPTLDQRKRVLQLLTTLTPHYTKKCTRNAQPLYAQQALDRYKPLIGHSPPLSPSWLSSLLGQDNDDIHAQQRRDLQNSDHKYFFAINLYNSFDVIPDLFATLFRVSAILGYHNVFVSIYENGSTDQTKALLRIFDALTRSVGMRVMIRTSTRTRGAFNHRIEYLAEVRNSAFVPLHELRDSEGEYFDSIVFMNDILPCVDDLLELIWQSRRNNAGITCAADYMYHEEIQAPVFYDNWVARDINGTALENAPFERVFHHQPSSNRWQKHLPIQVQSCWNGIAVLDPAPFYSPAPVKFRMARITEGECSASECSLICNDYWEAGFGRIMMVPRVKLAYDSRVYDIIHPNRRNLTAIRGYTRLGGLPDDPRTDPQDRTWFGPHDRLFIEEESEPLEFEPGPSHVWCWGWDGAGDLDGPDVDPIWEPTPNKSRSPDAVVVRHDRSMNLL